MAIPEISQRQEAPSRASNGPLIGGLLVVVAFVSVFLLLMNSTGYDTWGALPVGLILFVVSLPIFARQAAREGDKRLFWFLTFALLLKLLGAIPRHFVAFGGLYVGADARDFLQWGAKLAPLFRSGNFHSGLPTLTSTNFIRFFTGIVYALIGPTGLGAFFFYSWLGFWGLFLSYRAFLLAVPEGRHRTYARLVFFLPSLIYWPSSVGKEAWMMFALGVAAYGAARMLSGKGRNGLLLAVAGLWLAALVRPHVAGMMALGIAGGYVLRASRSDSRPLSPIFKFLGLALVIVGTLYFTTHASHFLEDQGIRTQKGVSSALGQVTLRTQEGGSKFVPSVLQSPERTPVAMVTVLFRPFITDAHNAQSLVAALEGTFLLLLCVLRFRWILAAIRSMRRQPYVAFALVYVAVFTFAFSSVANFGILARERVQVLPMFLVLLSIPPPKHEEPKKEELGVVRP